MAKASTAFAVVHYSCATGYYSFAHELRHLMGARHDRRRLDHVAFRDGHGFQHTASPAWRTVMAYDCTGGCSRLQYWSNPNVNYSGQAMGTTGQDNARVLNGTAGPRRLPHPTRVGYRLDLALDRRAMHRQ